MRQYFNAKKLESQNVTREKLSKAILYRKGWSKMMVKFTPVEHFHKRNQ